MLVTRTNDHCTKWKPSNTVTNLQSKIDVIEGGQGEKLSKNPHVIKSNRIIEETKEIVKGRIS